jgi:hypothetical protein
LATTLARCAGTEHIRPVLADQANLASRYQRRLPLYRTAHVSIPVDALTPDCRRSPSSCPRALIEKEPVGPRPHQAASGIMPQKNVVQPNTALGL